MTCEFGQSSNDVFPTAIHISSNMEVENSLIPALENLSKSLTNKVNEFEQVLKIEELICRCYSNHAWSRVWV